MKARTVILGSLTVAVMTTSCAAAASTASGNAARPATRYHLVAFSMPSQQAIGSDLVGTQDFSITPTIRSGYACFAIGKELLEWPPGYSAARSGNASVQVFDAQGKVVLRTGRSAYWDQAEISAGANACVSKPSTVLAIVEVVPRPS